MLVQLAGSGETMPTHSLPSRLLAGAGAGLAATVGMHGMRTTTQKLVPHTMPPIREDPGKFMVDRAESVLPAEKRERIPDAVESTASTLLHLGYGMTAGLLYAALGRRRSNLVRDGLGLGLAVWAAGYLGWLPRTRLMPSVTEQRPEQVLVPLLHHGLFGIAVVATYDKLQHRFG